MIDETKLPYHIAIIMDGNGRWARARGLPRIVGHRAGVETVRRILEAGRDIGIKMMTLYAFSTENWKRPTKEVEVLFGLLETYLDREGYKFDRDNIRFNVIGDMAGLPEGLRKKLDATIERTRANSSFALNLALNYGSRHEIVQAVKAIAKEVAGGKLDAETIDEECVSDRLYTSGLPDPDLVIRTSGENRISNFLLWQISYSELYFTEKLWPDFNKNDLFEAIVNYQKRERRFGKTSEQLINQ